MGTHFVEQNRERASEISGIASCTRFTHLTYFAIKFVALQICIHIFLSIPSPLSLFAHRMCFRHICNIFCIRQFASSILSILCANRHDKRLHMNDMPRRKSIAKFMVIVEQYTIYLFIYFLYLDSRIPLKVKIFSKSAGRMPFLQLESFRAIFVLSKRIRVRIREKNLLSKLK